MIQKASQGIYPSIAPLGYTNNLTERKLAVDPVRSPYITKAFELYASGSHSLRSLHLWLIDQGFRNKKGGKIVHSAIEKILKNPIYYGYFPWKGIIYKGIHTPLISKELFDKVQNRMHRKSYPVIATKKEFPFRSLLTCGRCGCRWTAANAKNRYKKEYTYYHCSFTHYKCGNPYIEENVLANLFGEQVVKKIFVENGKLDWLKEALKRKHESSNTNKVEQVAYLKTALNRIDKRIDALYNDKLDGKIPEDFWQQKHSRFSEEKINLETSLSRIEDNKVNYYEDSKKIFELAETIYPLYVKADLKQKAGIAKIITSNCTVNDATLYPTIRKPFNYIAEGLLCTEKLPREGSNLGHIG